MSNFGALLFLLLLSYTPHTSRTQRLSGAPLIMATKNLLAMMKETVRSANIDGMRTETEIKAVMIKLQGNATIIQKRINTAVDDTLVNFQSRIENLGINSSDVVVNDCAMQSSFVKPAAAKILMDAKSCVSNTLASIERKLSDTYSSIESILGRINSDQNLAETCVAEYDKTEMALRNAVVVTLCVVQAKERILSAIEDELSPRNDAECLYDLYIDALNQLTSCDDSTGLASFVADTDEIITCVSNLHTAKTVK